MKVKHNEIVEFLAISWSEPQWEFDHPTVVLKPFIQYSSNGEDCEMMIEDMAIDVAIDADTIIGNGDIKDDDVSQEFEWRGWRLEYLRRVARERLAGKDTWKTKIRNVVKQKIRFYKQGDEMEFEVMETVSV